MARRLLSSTASGFVLKLPGREPFTIEGIASLIDNKFEQHLHPVVQNLRAVQADVGRADTRLTSLSKPVCDISSDAGRMIKELQQQVEQMSADFE
eukprot:2910260-Pyramimonas_sp.AAC.1